MIGYDRGKNLPVLAVAEVVLAVVEMVVMGMGFVMKKEVVLMVLWNDNGDGVYGEEREEGDRQSGVAHRPREGTGGGGHWLKEEEREVFLGGKKIKERDWDI